MKSSRKNVDLELQVCLSSSKLQNKAKFGKRTFHKFSLTFLGLALWSTLKNKFQVFFYDRMS